MNILIAEDDKLLQQALEAKFTDDGARCVICSDGKETLEKMKNEQFEAIVLDLVMPEVDGFSVLQEKSSTQNASTPTFVVSNLGAADAHKRAMDLGATKCYLKAKVTLKGLVKEIMEAVEK
jgi:DNA-binding response OmpR family regulator